MLHADDSGIAFGGWEHDSVHETQLDLAAATANATAALDAAADDASRAVAKRHAQQVAHVAKYLRSGKLVYAHVRLGFSSAASGGDGAQPASVVVVDESAVLVRVSRALCANEAAALCACTR